MEESTNMDLQEGGALAVGEPSSAANGIDEFKNDEEGQKALLKTDDPSGEAAPTQGQPKIEPPAVAQAEDNKGNLPDDAKLEAEAAAEGDDAKPPALSMVEQEAQRLALLRKRNAVYSKRKYYKKKREVAKLEQTRYELEGSNHMLKRENKRLETLLLECQQKIALQSSMSGFPPSLLAQGLATNAAMFNPQLISSLMAPNPFLVLAGASPAMTAVPQPVPAAKVDTNNAQLRNLLTTMNPGATVPEAAPATTQNKELLNLLGNQVPAAAAGGNLLNATSLQQTLAQGQDPQLQLLLATLNQQQQQPQPPNSTPTNPVVARLPTAAPVAPTASNNEALLQLLMLQQLQNQQQQR